MRILPNPIDDANITIPIEEDTKKNDFDRIRMVDFMKGQPFPFILATATTAIFNISWVAFDILRNTNSCPGPLLDSYAKASVLFGIFGVTLCARQEIPRGNWNKLTTECKIATAALAIHSAAMLANA